jgi:uncharacterized protein
MLKALHAKSGSQLIIGFLIGVVFGFLLQKGGVTRYDVIIGQLLLTDFTVLKVMLSAVVTGTIGVYALKGAGLAQLHPKPGSFGSSVLGGLVFGVGFGILGYCPGTAVGAVAQGSLDALFGGVVGIIIGVVLFAAVYPKLEKGVMKIGDFGETTIPQVMRVSPPLVIVPLCAAIIWLLFWLESIGL